MREAIDQSFLVTTINKLSRYSWDEAKRLANLAKHGLDFADAGWVLESDLRLDIAVVRKGEARIQSLAYVFGQLRVLVVVHVPGDDFTRIVSFRTASTDERRAYHDWLAQEDPEADPEDDQEAAERR